MPESVIEAMSFLAILALLDGTSSVSVVARSVARHWQQQGAVHILPVEFPLVLSPVGIVCMKGRQHAKSVSVMTDAVHDAVKELSLLPTLSRVRQS